MEIINYSEATEFVARTKPILLKEEAANSLMLGISAGLTRNPIPNVYIATVEDEQTLLAAALLTPPFNLIVNAFTEDFRPAFELIAQNLAESNWKVRGVLGRADFAIAFAEIFSRAAGLPYRAGLKERLYKLTEVIPPPPVPGSIVQATEANTELVASWLAAFEEEALAGEVQRDNLEIARVRIGNGDIYLWQDGKFVAIASKARPTETGCSIGYVYTPAEFRGKGYASACTAALSQLILDSGKEFCVLFTDLSNPTSNNIYQKIGYRPVCDFDEYLFG